MPFPSPGDLPHLGIEPGSPALQADFSLSEPPEKCDLEKMICLLEPRFLHLEDEVQ